MDQYDAIVVGGSFAGPSAAMMLARGGRQLPVINAGRARNRFAPASHGVTGQDGAALTAALAEEGVSLTLPDRAAVRGRKLIATSQMYNATLASAAGVLGGVAAHGAMVLEAAAA